MSKTKTSTKRAAKGGELGANGEWYEGGKFIATTDREKKLGSTPKAAKSRKVQIEPYVWVVDTRRPLFSFVGVGAEYDRQTKTMRPYMPAFENFGGGVMYNGTTIEEIQAICDRFNAGERWQ